MKTETKQNNDNTNLVVLMVIQVWHEWIQMRDIQFTCTISTKTL